jgi:hypothetical protein
MLPWGSLAGNLFFESELEKIEQLQSECYAVQWADVLMMDRNLAWCVLTSLRECTTYQDPRLVSETESDCNNLIMYLIKFSLRQPDIRVVIYPPFYMEGCDYLLKNMPDICVNLRKQQLMYF